MFVSCLLCLVAADPQLADRPTDSPQAATPQTIVLLGGTMIEREQEHGDWEAAIRTLDPTTPYRLRNLAWSGDTVWAESRGRFRPPAEAYPDLIKTVAAIKPDRLILGYGRAEALSANRSVDDFVAQYRTLLSDLPDGPRTLLGIPLLGLDRLPDDVRASQKARMERFEQAIAELAAETGSRFVPLSEPDLARPELTDGGLQWNAAGYAASAPAVATLTVANARSPLTLSVDQAAELRSLIQRKNRLVFHRFRPQNTTYLLLFRKHEQGQNAAEIPRFDPAITNADLVVDRLLQSAR